MAGKMKGFDAKQFFVNHGEKIGFAVVLVLVVLGLAGTDWVPYDKVPSDITSEVEKAQAELARADWKTDSQMEADRKKYELDPDAPEKIVVASLSSAIPLGPFAPSQRLTKSIVEMDRPLTEPEFLPVEDLIATQARVFIELPPEDATDSDATEEGTESKPAENAIAEEDVPDELRERRGGSAGSPTAGAFGGGYGGYGGDDGEANYGSMEAPELSEMYASYYGEDAGEEFGEDASGMYGEGMYGGGAMSNRRGKGYPFVSVRGVFPFKNQIMRYTEAIRRGYAEAARKFMIVDFNLQRQELGIATHEWSDWVDVDIKVLRDVINEASGIEPDIVSAAVTDSAITCPLPIRLTGVWDTQATHPRLKNFELSDADLEREMQFNRALLKEYMDKQQNLPDTGKVTPRGFSDMVFNSRTLQAGVMGAESSYDYMGMGMGMGMGMEGYGMEGMDGGEYGGYSGYAGSFGSMGMGARTSATGTGQTNPQLDRFVQELAKQFKADQAGEAEEQLKDWIKERAAAEGELLLYRYIDFNVQPGHTYRYRVRLQLLNPNYKQTIAAAGGVEHVILGETRPTPWSDPTKPVRVNETVQYFVNNVEDNRGRMFPDTKMQVFQWDTDLGTVVHDQLTIEVGQEIGGKDKVGQINPAKQTYEEENYVFTSNDRLVDGIMDLSFARNEHPDLQLPTGSRREAQIVEYALVVQDDVNLVSIDPVTQADDLATQEFYITKQDELYKNLIEKKDAREGGPLGDGEYGDLYSDLYGEEMDMGGMGEEMGGRGGRPRRNSLRRGGGRRRGGYGDDE